MRDDIEILRAVRSRRKERPGMDCGKGEEVTFPIDGPIAIPRWENRGYIIRKMRIIMISVVR